MNKDYNFIYYSLNILVSCWLLISCGYEPNYRKTAASAFSSGIEKGGRPLSDMEMGVAQRVCYAFRSKRVKFSAELMGNPFNFVYVTNNCDGGVISEPLHTTLSQVNVGGSLSFESTFLKAYNREVQTDIHGYLAKVCEQVLKGETPLNYLEQNNESFEYAFSSSVYDKIDVLIGNQNLNSGNIAVNRMISLEVLTNQTSAGDYLGLVVKTTSSFPCDNNNIKTISQNFSGL